MKLLSTGNEIFSGLKDDTRYIGHELSKETN